MNFLITGSSGFIGQNLISALRKDGHKTIGIDLNKPNYIFPDKFIKQSFCDLDYLKLLKKIDVIIHLAANGGVPKSVKDPIGTLNTNLIGFVNLLENLKTLKKVPSIKVIYASSGGTVVGDSEKLITEDSRPRPKSPFGISKYCSEMFSNFYEKNYSLDLIGLRFTNVYGPMMDQKPNFISKLMLCSLNNEQLNIYGDGNQSRDFIYVEDVVQSIMLASISPYKGILQIGSGTNISINEIIKKLSDTNIAKVPSFNYQEIRTEDVIHVRCCCKKAFEKIGFKSKTNIENGLKETYLWFKNFSNLV